MNLFPMFVKLHSRLVVVVGGGEIAAGKIDGLLKAGANVRLIAPRVHSSLVSLIRTRKIEWFPREFAVGDLDGASLAIAATSAPGVNGNVFRYLRVPALPAIQAFEGRLLVGRVRHHNEGHFGAPFLRPR